MVVTNGGELTKTFGTKLFSQNPTKWKINRAKKAFDSTYYGLIHPRAFGPIKQNNTYQCI